MHGEAYPDDYYPTDFSRHGLDYAPYKPVYYFTDADLKKLSAILQGLDNKGAKVIGTLVFNDRTFKLSFDPVRNCHVVSL